MTLATPLPKDRVRIFARDGATLAQFQTSVERSWVIGEEGRAWFSYAARNTSIVNEKLLRFGNWILIENSALGMPWVGMIDTPRSWSSKRVTVYCYDPLHIFGQRRGAAEYQFTGMSAGSLFLKVLAFTNGLESTIIEAGDVWEGGRQIDLNVRPGLLNNFIRDITEQSGEEYSFRPVVNDKGYLKIFVDWSEKIGVETSVYLQEGKRGGNLETSETELSEEGPIMNDLLAYGEGETWDTKPKATLTDETSRQLYGLRQDVYEVIGSASIAGVGMAGQSWLNRYKYPTNTFSLRAINMGDTFKYLSMGNVLTARLSVGFNPDGTRGKVARVRIVGMYYNPEERTKIDLRVTEVIE